ncbi:MAG TPA: efflux transporter outer membrane subunit [Gammaproteobacteria bacterium]|nr:efflux transporter outer membrane subunit [Gammaproteobacteria bacterium]
MRQATRVSNRSELIAGITLLAGAVMSGGCTMIGPDFDLPEAELPQQWNDEDTAVTGQQPADYSQWWLVFQDPVLTRLVETARNQNLTLQIAGLRVLEARAQLGIVTGNLYPQSQTVSGNYSYNRGRETLFSDKYFSQAGGGFDVAWEMDFWGKFRRSLESADANLLASVAGYDDVLVTLTAEVARNYVLIRTLEERIRLARENIAIQQRSLELTTNQFETGSVTELDMQQATTQLRNTQATVPGLQISLDKARHALSILMGMPPGDLEDMLDSGGPIPTAPAEVATGIPAELLRRRPDIRQAELQAAAQSAQVGVAGTELLPAFSLFGSFGWNVNDAGQDSLGDLFDSNSFYFSTGPSFRWKIFNYGRLKNQVRVQDARLEQLLSNYENTVLTAAGEVEDAISGFLNSRQEAEFRGQSAAAAERSSDLSMLQYSEGVSLYQSVLDSNRSLAAQQDAYAQVRGNIAINLIALYKALGGGWETRTDAPFVPVQVQQKMRERTDWGKLLDISEDNVPTLESDSDRWPAPDW